MTELQPVASCCPSTTLFLLLMSIFPGVHIRLWYVNSQASQVNLAHVGKQSHLGQLEAAMELWGADPAHMLSSLASQEGIAEDASSVQQATDALLPCHTHNCTGRFLCHANVTPACQKSIS